MPSGTDTHLRQRQAFSARLTPHQARPPDTSSENTPVGSHPPFSAPAQPRTQTHTRAQYRPAPASGRLTQRQALAQLAAVGIKAPGAAHRTSRGYGHHSAAPSPRRCQPRRRPDGQRGARPRRCVRGGRRDRCYGHRRGRSRADGRGRAHTGPNSASRTADFAGTTAGPPLLRQLIHSRPRRRPHPPTGEPAYGHRRTSCPRSRAQSATPAAPAPLVRPSAGRLSGTPWLRAVPGRFRRRPLPVLIPGVRR